jgi:hypothetical protein
LQRWIAAGPAGTGPAGQVRTRAAANAGPDPAAGARMETGRNGPAAPALVDSMY